MTGSLDAWLPVSHWSTRHDRFVAAPPETVSRAVREVRTREMRLVRPLVAARSLPSQLLRRGAEQRAAADADTLSAMRQLGFIVLDDVPGADLVLGFAGQPWNPIVSRAVVPDLTPADFDAFRRPHFVKGAYALWTEPEGAGTRLFTETRVYAIDRGAARRFRPYWLLIEPFSALIRRDWLAAIGRRAEGAARTGGTGIT
ncbi:hypothetical protein AB0M97_02980 [Streptomyces sp. NPDC051207]|uniref:hypothetical protein n=1 Tax=Streptomyces sp. NPDC051207 TaxID=3154641 RepID=UPI00342109CF